MSEASFVLICEGPTDDWVVRKLADRVFLERGAHWIQDVGLDSLRVWCGVQPNARFTKWTEVKSIAKEMGVRSLGHHRGEPLHADGAMVRKAIEAVRLKIGRGELRADGLILVRDVDNQPDRILGAAQALEEAAMRSGGSAFELIKCWVLPKTEAWILHGFAARDDLEAERLRQTRQELGFDPVREAHRLQAARTPGGAPAKRSAKRVLDVLCGGKHERKEVCIVESGLDQLLELGRETGLAAFLDEVKRKLLPLVERGSH